MTDRRLGALLLACLLPVAASHAQSEQALNRKALQQLEAWNELAPYLELVAAYRAGETVHAIAGVTEGSDALVKTVFQGLDTLGDRVRLCRQTNAAITGRTEAGEIEVVDLEAAVMLHTDAALDRLEHRDRFEFRVQLDAARRVLEWVRDTTKGWSREPRNLPPGCRPAPALSGRDWYVAVSQALLGYWELDAARALATRGLELAPDDPELLVTLGTIVENAPESAPPTMLDLAQHRSPRPTSRGPRTAERFFRRAVEADPDLLEAHLRLGRVLALLGRPDEARTKLELVLKRSTDAGQRYLAALFLGRVLEEGGRADDAVASYRIAMAERPDAQTARLALAHALSAGGGSPAAVALLRDTIGRPWRPSRAFDPWWTYPFRPFAEGLAALDVLRRQVVRP